MNRAHPRQRWPLVRHPSATGRLDMLICATDVLIRVDPHLTTSIDHRYSLPAGTVADVLSQRPTATLAAAGLLPYPQWLAGVRRILPTGAVDSWLAYHGELNQPVARLLQAAAQCGVHLCLAGNATRRLWDNLAHHQVGHLAKWVFCSAHLGVLAPDPAFYRHIFGHTGADPTRTLLVASDPGWVDTAHQLGLPTHRYASPALLRTVLTRAGVTP